MNRSQTFTVAVSIAVLLLGMARPAYAQPAVPTGPIARPTFSPYLNLLRGGNSAAFNYYGLVRPEQNALRNFQGLQAGVANNQAAINTFIGTGGPLGSTGVPAQFMNYGGYFMNAGMMGQTPRTGSNSGPSTAGRANRTTAGAVSPRR
jgi:hypothetical protein